MNLVDTTIILGLSLVAHLFVTGVALGVTLSVAQWGTRKTLKKAEDIEARIQKQIDKMNKEITMEDKFYGMMDDFLKEQKQMMSGYMGLMDKKMEEKIQKAEQEIKTQAGVPASNLDKVLGVAMQFIPQ